MLYRIDLLLRANIEAEVLHEVLLRANTYAIVETVEGTAETDGECRFMAKIDAPSPEAALGVLLTVIAQTSGHVGLAEEGSVRRIAIERDEPLDRESEA
jgi:hypothetical protein